LGWWTTDDEIVATWRPGQRVEPGASSNRERWQEAVARSRKWIPDLSALDFVEQ
jgi:hypothetical protein